MRNVLTRVAIGVCTGFIATGIGPVYGQQGGLSSTAADRGNGGLGATAQAPALQGPRTLFTLEGTTVHIWAPLQAPYSGSAYENLAGQPMRGGDSILTPNALVRPNEPGSSRKKQLQKVERL